GTGVWVEFEQGDPDYPIWSGCWYGSAAEVPVLALAPPPAVPNMVLQTQGQNPLLISDVPRPTGGVLTQTFNPARPSSNSTGINTSNGQGAIIAMMGPTVNINAGALTVV